jgi:Protein of unknown function (DUF998)
MSKGGATGRGGRLAAIGTVPPRAAWACGVCAGLAYSGWVVDLAVAPDHDWHSVVSGLQVPGAPLSTLLRVLDVACGVLVLALVPGLAAALPGRDGREVLLRRVAIWGTVVFALGCIGAAVVPLPSCAVDEVCRTGAQLTRRVVHDGFSVASQAGVFVAAAAVGLLTRGRGPRWLHRAAWAAVWLGGVSATVLLLLATAPVGPSWGPGVGQRFQIVVTSLWLVALGAVAADGARSARDPLPPEAPQVPGR